MLLCQPPRQTTTTTAAATTTTTAAAAAATTTTTTNNNKQTNKQANKQTNKKTKQPTNHHHQHHLKNTSIFCDFPFYLSHPFSTVKPRQVWKTRLGTAVNRSSLDGRVPSASVSPWGQQLPRETRSAGLKGRAKTKKNGWGQDGLGYIRMG